MRSAPGRNVEGNVDELVLLAADQAAAAGLHQQRADLDVVPVGGGFRVPQEAGVDARVAERQGLPVHLHRPLEQRADQVLGRVLEGEQITAMLPALLGQSAGRSSKAAQCVGAFRVLREGA